MGGFGLRTEIPTPKGKNPFVSFGSTKLVELVLYHADPVIRADFGKGEVDMSVFPKWNILNVHM
jgi:hypothetical protein